MDVSCPACAARYTADDEKLRGKTARMRCKACNTVWVVSGPGAGPAVTSAISTPPPPAASAASIAPAASVPPASLSNEESKRAAVVKTGAEREKRDLFAEREPEGGLVKQTLLPPAAFGFTAGARNETSVLFRVDQLAAAGRVKTPEPEKAPSLETSASDDEGIIDLKALSSAAPSARRAGVPIAPLFSEPPAVTLELEQTRGRGKGNSRLRFVAGLAAAAVVLVAAGFGISVAFKGEEPVKHTPLAATAPPPPPPTEAPPPPKVEPPPTTASAEETKDVKETKEPKAKKGKKGKRKAASQDGSKASTSAAKPAPVKAADPCGCKGDFNCNLACAAKGGK